MVKNGAKADYAGGWMDLECPEAAVQGVVGVLADGEPHPSQTAGSSHQASRLGGYGADVIHEVSGGRFGQRQAGMVAMRIIGPIPHSGHNCTAARTCC